MFEQEDDLGHDDPAGGHDPKALEEAARRMRATKAGSRDYDRSTDDPTGGHDPAALKDAAKKMGIE
jgi:hypothetical protein